MEPRKYTQKNSSRMCKFGSQCRNRNCRFIHPSDDAEQEMLRDMASMNIENIQVQHSPQTQAPFFQIQQENQNTPQQNLVQRIPPFLENQQFPFCTNESQGTNFPLLRGRGRIRGRGRFNERGCFRNHQAFQEKQFDQQFSEAKINTRNGKYRKSRRKHSQTDSDSEKDQHSSSDESANSPEPKNKLIKKPNKKSKNQKPQVANWESYQEFSEALLPFFQARNIKPVKRQKILEYLSSHWSSAAVVEVLVPMIEQFEKEGLINKNCYKRVIRIICSQNFIEEAVKKKLIRRGFIDEKRSKKDKEFRQKFPNPAQIDFLESEDLLYNEFQNGRSIYLIDGNNCMVTQKHFRSYFQSQSIEMKAEAQIRLQWLLSLVIDPSRCVLFFDDQFDPLVYEKVKSEILYEAERVQMEKIKVFYAKKEQQADQLIRQKLEEIVQVEKDGELRDIILVTADKILSQMCFAIHFLRKSSGQYLFKFCKKIIKQRYMKDPLKKGILKRIFMYRYQ